MCKLYIVRSVDLWVVDRISIMYVAGGAGPVDLWVVDRISIMYEAGVVDLWTCGLWTEYLSCM